MSASDSGTQIILIIVILVLLWSTWQNVFESEMQQKKIFESKSKHLEAVLHRNPNPSWSFEYLSLSTPKHLNNQLETKNNEYSIEVENYLEPYIDDCGLYHNSFFQQHQDPMLTGNLIK